MKVVFWCSKEADLSLTIESQINRERVSDSELKFLVRKTHRPTTILAFRQEEIHAIQVLSAGGTMCECASVVVFFSV